MHWFLDPILKHYVDFEGRVGRQEFWMFVLFSFILQVVLDIIGLDAISPLVSLLILLPSLAIGARRLHDIGKSGWWQLLGLIPIIGWIILIVWLAQKSDAADNIYGKPANPKMAVSTGAVPSPNTNTPSTPTESPETK